MRVYAVVSEQMNDEALELFGDHQITELMVGSRELTTYVRRFGTVCPIGRVVAWRKECPVATSDPIADIIGD